MSSNLPQHGTGSLKHGWILPPCASTEKNGKRKAHSLRRHYPVQVRRDFLSLICLHPWPNCQCKSRCRHPTSIIKRCLYLFDPAKLSTRQQLKMIDFKSPFLTSQYHTEPPRISNRFFKFTSSFTSARSYLRLVGK